MEFEKYNIMEYTLNFIHTHAIIGINYLMFECLKNI